MNITAGLPGGIRRLLRISITVGTMCTPLYSQQNMVDSLPADSSDSAAVKHVQTLPNMVVTTRRMEKIISNPMVESPALELALTRIDEQSIENQNARTALDALTYAPGAWIESRGRKVKQFVSFRGQKYPYPDYAVDGVWQREFDELPYFFPASEIEGIEVMRSSAALVNGVSGLAGIINIIPKTYDRAESNIAADYGSDKTVRANLSHGNRIGSLNYALGGEVFTTDGPANRNAAEKRYNFFSRMKWQGSENLSVQTNVFGLYGMRELTTIETPGNTKKFSKPQRFDPYRALIMNARALLRENERMSSSLLLHYTRRNLDFYATDTLSSLSANDMDWEWGANLTQALSLGDNNVLRIGALYNNWRAPEGKRFYSGKAANVHTISTVLADEHSFGNLTVDGGIRWLRNYLDEWAAYNIDGSYVWKTKDGETQKPKNAKLEAVKDTWEPSQLHGNLGVVYSLANHLKMMVNGAFGQVRPNPGSITSSMSQPENENQIKLDAGFKLWHEPIGDLQVSGFYILRKDGLRLTPDFGTVNGAELPFYENRDMATTGVECVLGTARFFETIRGDINFTAMQHSVKTNDEFITDEEKPALIVGGALHVERFGFDLHIYGKYVSEYESNRFAADKAMYKLGDYSSLSATLGYTHSFRGRHRVRVFTNLENITDERFSTVVGYPDFGRRFYGGIQYSL
ncbi:MAG: TonB-dependent receptor [Chitinivibrionales bacterium]